MTFEIVNPKELGEPKGWNNGALAPKEGGFSRRGAGRMGARPGEPPASGETVARPDKVLLIVREAGGEGSTRAGHTMRPTPRAARG